MANEIALAIGSAKEQFCKVIASNPHIPVEWQREANFAMQQVYKNPQIVSAAMQNKQSLRDAIIQVAAVGITLNPAHQYAYLVPMDGAINLFISYRGLIKIATDTGSIEWVRAEVVYSSDTFTYFGPAKEPIHKANPFLSEKDRGEVVGVYCIAKTCNGDILCDAMSEDEIRKIKAASKSSGSAYSPWNKWPNEMRKKAVIKRGSKTWPKTERHEQLDKVIEMMNKEEGIDFDEEVRGQVTGEIINVDQCIESFEVFKSALDADSDEPDYKLIQEEAAKLSGEEYSYVIGLFGDKTFEGSRKTYKNALNECVKMPLDADGNRLAEAG